MPWSGEEATPEEIHETFGVRQLIGREFIEELVLWFNEPEAREVGVPGAGGFGRAVDLALYYQELLHNPNGIWKPELLADVHRASRSRLPDPMKVPANRSLGLLLAGDDGFANLRGLGRTVSPARSATTARAGSWRGPTRPPDSRSATRPTATTATPCANPAGARRSGRSPGSAPPPEPAGFGREPRARVRHGRGGKHEEPGRGGSTRLFINSLPAPEGGSTLGSSTRST